MALSKNEHPGEPGVLAHPSQSQHARFLYGDQGKVDGPKDTGFIREQRCCSLQGILCSQSVPGPGVGLASLIRSMNPPGSPEDQAQSTICAKSSLALTLAGGLWSGVDQREVLALGHFPWWSVTATDRLKFWYSPVPHLAWIKSMISGWSTRRIPIFAPLLVPPCFTASVLEL